jgi:thiamine biosynthesis lipoprotein ApbE
MTTTELSPPIVFRALGTTAVLAVADASVRDHAHALLDDELAAIDHTCSRFRDDSELAHVNAADGRAVATSALFVEAVDVALRAARLTEGRVDPTIGNALRILGYDRDFDTVERDGGPLRVRAQRVAGWRRVQVDHLRRTVRVPRGVALDLGATAKALAADRAAARIATVTGSGVLVSLGGDCAVAGDAPDDGWNIRVADRHDDDPQRPGPTIALRAGGIATSGTAARRWRRGGQDLHHVIDPATGTSAAEVWRTVTVAASSCVDANIASTAAIVLGAAALEWLSERGLAARLVGPDGQVQTTESWPTTAA